MSDNVKRVTKTRDASHLTGTPSYEQRLLTELGRQASLNPYKSNWKILETAVNTLKVKGYSQDPVPLETGDGVIPKEQQSPSYSIDNTSTN